MKLFLSASLLASSVFTTVAECNPREGTCASETQANSMLQGLTMLHSGSLGDSQGPRDMGHADCPCLTLDQTDVVPGGTFPEKVYQKKLPNGTTVNWLPGCDPGSDEEWYFPMNIGVGGCTSFAGLAPFCGAGTEESPKTWDQPWMCAAKFCMVDADRCTPSTSFIPGNLFPGLSFSYLTCDNTGIASEEQLTMATKLLRNDHRAYHCANGQVDDGLENDAKKVEQTR